MVEVEAAQEILVGFALPAVLGDDEAGRDLQNFAGARDRRGIDFFARHLLLARRVLANRSGRRGRLSGSGRGTLGRRGGARAWCRHAALLRWLSRRRYADVDLAKALETLPCCCRFRDGGFRGEQSLRREQDQNGN